MKKIKITAAYCVELGETVEIERAHEASMEKNGIRFQFLCSSEECRNQGVPITGANYHLPLSEQKQAMHFRDNKNNKHHESCDWFVANEYFSFEGTHDGETDAEADLRRKLYTLLPNDFLITNYDPYEPDTGVRTDNSTESTVQKPQGSGSKTPQSRYNEAAEKILKTSSFYKLVRCHYELSKKFKKVEEFKQFPLKVKSRQRTWFDYFQIFTYVWNKQEFDGIMFGYISTDIKEYGAGYLISMMSKLNKFSVSIYISPVAIKNYRRRRELTDILDNIKNFEDVNAYFIPESIELVTRPSGKPSYQIKISNLQNLRLVGSVKET